MLQIIETLFTFGYVLLFGALGSFLLFTKVPKEEGMENVLYFKNKDAFFKEMDSIIGKGDVILLKGSRGMAMDKIVSKIME